MLQHLSFLIITTAFLTLSMGGMAHDFTTDHTVYNWNNEIIISVEDLHDEINYEAYEIWTGDDGEECDASVWDIEITNYISPTSFEFAFKAEQDFMRSWACIAGTFHCAGKVDVIPNAGRNGRHKITSKIGCDYQF